MIRPADQSDIVVLVKVLRESFAGVADRFKLTIENCPKNLAFCTEQRLKEDFDRGLQFYILEEDVRPCGCVALEKADSDRCYLERLAVLPEHRRKGFGKALVEHIFSEAAKIGAKQVEIGIIDEDEKLRNWYEQFGFALTRTQIFDHLPFIIAFMAAKL